MPNLFGRFTLLADPEGKGRPWKRFDQNEYDNTVCCWCGVRVPQGGPVIFRRVGGFLHPACWAQKFDRTVSLADPAIPREEFPPEKRPATPCEPPQVVDPVSPDELDALFKDV